MTVLLRLPQEEHIGKPNLSEVVGVLHYRLHRGARCRYPSGYDQWLTQVDATCGKDGAQARCNTCLACKRVGCRSEPHVNVEKRRLDHIMLHAVSCSLYVALPRSKLLVGGDAQSLSEALEVLPLLVSEP